jgi:hypothetical protein
MMTASMNWDSVLPIITAYMPALLVVAIGMWVNNKRIDDLRAEMHRGFEALEKLTSERLRRVEEVLDARLKLIEDRLSVR